MKTDPVCGQSVDPLRARAIAIVAGEKYYFCSAEHKAQFAADPSRYIASLRPALVVDEPPAPAVPEPAPALETGPTPLPDLADGSPAPAPISLPPRPSPPPTADLVRFEIGGMTGPEDAERVKKAIARVAGVSDVEIDLVTEVATLAVAHERFQPPELVEAVATAGYEAAPRARSPREDLDAVAARADLFRRRAVAAFAIAAALAALAVLAGGPGWLYAAVAAGAAGVLARRLPARWPEIVAGAGALVLVAEAALHGDGQAAAGALALAGMALAGRAVEARARHAAGEAISGLAALPASARRVGDDGVSTEVAVADLAAGQLVRIGAGDVIPVDGVVRSGAGTIDESQVAGPGAPVLREAGDSVVAGSAVVAGTILVEVKRAGRDRTLARLRSAVLELQGSTSPLTRLAARAEMLAPAAAGTAALVAVTVQFMLGRPLATVIAAGVAALAACSPLGPALATPAALAIATVRAARRGVVFRNAEAFERAHDVSLIVVDKSATLTQGRRQVSAHAVEAGADGGRLIALAAAAEQMSDAPLARALRAYATQEGVLVPPADRATFSPGKGVAATIAGTQVVVGSRRMLEENGVARERLDAIASRLDGGARQSGIFVAIDGQLAGAIAIDEPLRNGATRFVEALGQLGVAVALVTGDGSASARAIAEDAGIGKVFSDLSPDDKKRIIAGLRGGRGAVAVVGDGVDDAAALTAADVGIALGRSADVALAAHAVTIVRGDLDGVLAALGGARSGVGVMRRNLALVFGHAALVTLIAAVLALGPSLPFAVAATTTLIFFSNLAGSLRA